MNTETPTIPVELQFKPAHSIIVRPAAMARTKAPLAQPVSSQQPILIISIEQEGFDETLGHYAIAEIDPSKAANSPETMAAIETLLSAYEKDPTIIPVIKLKNLELNYCKKNGSQLNVMAAIVDKITRGLGVEGFEIRINCVQGALRSPSLGLMLAYVQATRMLEKSEDGFYPIRAALLEVNERTIAATEPVHGGLFIHNGITREGIEELMERLRKPLFKYLGL